MVAMSKGEKTTGTKRLLKDRIEETALYMEAHFGDRLTRNQLAQMAGLNPEHYSRLFKTYKGQSPVDFLTELRIQAAKLLLQRPGITVKQVGRMVGFDDPYYFSRRFKLNTGAAPSAYKQEKPLRVVAVDYYGHIRALGIRPVGVSAGMVGLRGLLADWSDDALDVGIDEFPYYDSDATDQLKPDIVIGPPSWLQRGQCGAKVIEVDDKKDPLYIQFKAIGSALGLERQVEEWLRNYEERALELRNRLFRKMEGQTIAVFRVRADFLQMYGNQIMGYSLYHSLGLTPPYKLAKQFEINGSYHSTVINLDELPFFRADHLIVVVQPDEETRQVWADIQESSVWLSFPAVRSGNIYQVDVHQWLAYDPLSIMAQMEEAAVLLGAGIEGEEYE